MKLAGKRVLVTGSGGFVGRNLVKALKQQGVKVLALPDQDGRRADIRDWQNLKYIKDVDIIYHLAAQTFIPYSFDHPRETYEINVLGTLNLLELCRLCGVEKIVFASTYVYGRPQYLPIDEAHPLEPTSPYASSKLLAEDLCRAYHRDYGLQCVILRTFNIYGKGQKENFLIPTILNQLPGGKIELMDAEPKRDFLYIDDAVEAYLKCGEYNGSDFEIFNVGASVSYSVDQIVKKIVKLSKRDIAVHYKRKRRKNEIMDVVADISKAKSKLGWEPKVSLDDGLALTVL